MSQEDILVALVQGEDGRVWASGRKGWKLNDQPPVPLCAWDGVTCQDGTSVSSIVISESDFIGSIPPSIGQLTTLRTFDIRQNLANGAIPVEFANLPNLEIVDLSSNRLDGPVPIFQSLQLQKLILADNMLTGTLPENIGKGHPYLTDIDIIQNRLSGSLPKSLQELNSLTKLSLSENEFYGTIPEFLGSLSSMKYFYIDVNTFVGTIPRSLTPENSSLQEVWLQSNLLSGTVPAAFAEMANLMNLYVDGNKFTGQLPPDLCKANINADFFQDIYGQGSNSNNLLGTLGATSTPAGSGATGNSSLSIGNDDNLAAGSQGNAANSSTTASVAPGLSVSQTGISASSGRDYCASIACPRGTSSLEGVWPCKACEGATRNPYLGKQGSCFPVDEAAIIHNFWLATYGNDWSSQNNWYHDGVAMCDFTGITCNVENQILSLSLPNFNLHGTVPDELGFLEHLKTLDLSGNQFYGYLPADLRFAPLDILDISNNQLVGIVPPMLCRDTSNGNGRNGDYRCDSIACPSGTFSSTGRAGDGVSCQPCMDGAPTIGRTSCGGVMAADSASMNPHSKNTLVAFVILLIVLCAAFVGYTYFVKKRNSRKIRTVDDMEAFDVSDHVDTEINKMPPPADPLYMGTFPDSVHVDEMHDDDYSSVTRIKKRKGKGRKKKKPASETYETVDVAEDADPEDGQSAASNPLWLDVPKLETPRGRSRSPPSIA